MNSSLTPSPSGTFTHKCCYVREDGLSCPNQADFALRCQKTHIPTLDEGYSTTYTCPDHLGHLMEAEKLGYVWPIEWE